MRLGVFGGTFNPIHMGHLIVAQQTLDFFELHHIEFVPAKIPPHKPNEKILAPKHRYRMVELSIKNNPKFHLNDIELKRKGPSFTVDTLEILRSKGELYLIMGDDSFRYIETWDRYEMLFDVAKIIIVSRPGIEPIQNMEFDDFVRSKLEDSMIEISGMDLIDGSMQKGQWSVANFRIPGVNISSTDIRKRITLGQSIRYLVHDDVRTYILNQNLYCHGDY